MARSKNWCFTLNNYTEADEKNIAQWECRGVAYAHEVGESGTPHLQGYVCFAVQKGLNMVRELNNRAHWEIMKGSMTDNQTYCSKQGQLIVHGKQDIARFARSIG